MTHKKTWKKMVSMMMVGTFAMGAVGCGGKSAGKSAGKNESKSSFTDANVTPETGDVSYEFQEMLKDKYEKIPLGMKASGDSVYFITSGEMDQVSYSDSMSSSSTYGEGETETGDGETASQGDSAMAGMASGGLKFYKASLDGSNIEEIGSTDLDAFGFEDMIVGKDGSLQAIVYDIDETDMKYVYKILEVKDGKVEEKESLNEFLQGSGFILRAFFGDDDSIYVVGQNEITKYDSKRKVVYRKQIEEDIDSACLTRDGKLFLVSGTAEGKGLKGQVFDAKSGEKEGNADLHLKELYLPNNLIAGQGDYDAFIAVNSGLYGCQLNENKVTLLMDYNESGITANAITQLAPLSDGTVLAILMGSGTGQTEIGKMTKRDTSEDANRTEITFAKLYEDDSISAAISDFNQKHKDIHIKVLDYNNQENPEEALSADIAAGKTPDLVDLSQGMLGNLSIPQAVRKGYLEDLKTYFEKDQDVKLSDLDPNIEKALEIDGGLYVSASGFTPVTLVTTEDQIGDKKGWTYDEWKEFVEKQAEEKRLMGAKDRNEEIYTLLQGCSNDFVDWKEAKCSFDSEEFKDVLSSIKHCKETNLQEAGEENFSLDEYYSLKKDVFYEPWINPYDFSMGQTMAKKNYKIVGFPSKDGKGVYAQFKDVVGMMKTSEHKEDAWEFLKTFYSQEYESKKYVDGWSIPVRSDILKAYQTMLETKESYKDAYGNDICAITGMMSGEDGKVIESEPLGKEGAKEYLSVLEHLNTGYFYDRNINDIVMEESASYFKGDKDLDEVTKLIQDRVITYMNENK